ncbi:MAG: RNB domain-containing ribonuclease [Syntrophaceae bacterium]|nr:RNB domain-containing ribonuclease [Syntrophaceae bacterium]
MDAKSPRNHVQILRRIARRAMIERGFLPEFSAEVRNEVAALRPEPEPPGVRDLRGLPWCSIDSDESLDLDQLTCALDAGGGAVTALVAIADVDAAVRRGRAIDDHACRNTTSVYTPVRIFSMIPEELSTGLTSLNDGEDRTAVVVEMTVGAGGAVDGTAVYRARVHNRARLSYNEVSAWLDGRGPMPGAVQRVEGLAGTLWMQDAVAAKLRARRQACGALNLETVEARPILEGGEVRAWRVERKNRAKELIADFMIAANEAVARFLESRRYPSIRRVVHAPRRWERIADVAAQKGWTLPRTPDAKALESFLTAQRAREPERFHDLSQTVIKLIGPGEYMADFPGREAPGHFGLAVKDYAHSTAPNRRYPDLVTQRLVKAAIEGRPVPYGEEELAVLARHCTRKEDDANKVERLVRKSAFALLLESRVGETFDAVVTGAAPKGTWVRIEGQPVEGRLVEGFSGIDVGDRLRVRLVSTDVEQGYIDFSRIG